MTFDHGMPTRVKICGLKTAETMRAALEGGADLVGLVFFPPSPRNVSPEEAAALADIARGRAEIVALTVDADDALLGRIVGAVKPDMIQLHGSETPERVREVKRLTGASVMKAIKVETAADVEAAERFVGVADLVLFDAKAPKGLEGALPGGNGLSFDWRLVAAVKDRYPFMLSGGLTPDNVATAIRLTRAPAVDVSSGVERAPGEKDVRLISEFLAAAKAA